MKLLKRLLLLLLAVAVVYGAYYAWTNRPIPEFDRKILVFSKTTEYRHEAIPTGIKTLTNLGRRGRFNVEATEDAGQFTDENLSRFQTVVFLNTTGDVLDEDQQVAFERYIQAGGGYLGIHSASDTEWRKGAWYWYQRLVGGVFLSHPENSDQEATVSLVGKHSTTANLPPQWKASDEWYDFQRMSDGVNVLMSVDEGTYSGGQMGDNHPVAWYRDFDGGRSFYVALGHTESSYYNRHFLELVLGGLQYTMGDGSPLDYSRSRPESWRFNRQVLDSALDEPLKLAFNPAGELYFVERKGALRRYDFERQESVTVATLDVYTHVEYGLMGLAFDPDFDNNHWLYLYRTLARGDAGRSVLSRFKLIDGELDLASEEELLSFDVDGNAERRATHTGGDMQFDREGNLWLSTGDDTEAGDQGHIDDRPGKEYRDAARSAGNTHNLRGKILRIRPRLDRGYDIPAGNLFSDPASGLPEIYAMGVRNPYTIAYDDRSGYLYWGEVGPDGRAPSERGPWGFDEINRTRSNGNFGWPYVIADNRPYAYFDYVTNTVGEFVDPAAPQNRSGNNTGAKVLPPAQPAWMYYPYSESDRFWELGSGGRNALVAPLFYSEDYADSPIKFPPFMEGKLIISDFVRRWTYVVAVDNKDRVETITPLIHTPLSAPLDFAFGPDGALYIVEYGTNWFQKNQDSYISRIEFYAEDNPPPVAVASATKHVGAAPMETVLDASASFDRGDADAALSYRWQLVEQGKPGRELGSDQRQVVSFDEPGEYTVQLLVGDAEGASGSTRLHFTVGNEPPRVALRVKGNRSFFYSDTGALDYEVTVTDLEDGSIAAGTIPPEDVTVIFDYIGQSEDLARALAAHGTDPVLAGRALATRGSDCHACHAPDSASVGPSFLEVAQRYAERGDAAQYLAAVITGGGSGVWREGHSMPAHPDLEEEQLSQLAAYILSLADNGGEKAGAMAMAGTVQLSEHGSDYIDAVIEQVMTVDLGRFYPGSYVLHASYTDRGTATAGPLQGSDTVILRHGRTNPSVFDAVSGMRTYALGEGVSIAIFGVPSEEEPFAYGLISNVDLTGISTLEIASAAMKPLLSGGTLEVRLDDPGSTAVGRFEIEPSFSIDVSDSKQLVDLSAIEGVHDLYIGVSDSKPGGQVSIAVVSMEFKP